MFSKIFYLMLLADSCQAFQPQLSTKITQPRSLPLFATKNVNNVESSIKSDNRREFILKTLLTPTIALATSSMLSLSLPQPANADVTNKVASKSALRIVKRSMKELQDMELLAETSDYDGVLAALRVPPFTEIRKSCGTLIKGSEGGSEFETLQTLYKDFIKEIEGLSSAAGLGSRGKKGIELGGSYKGAVVALNNFYEVALRAVDIPMVNAEE